MKVVDYFSTRHQFFIGLCLRRTHDLSQSASANFGHQVRLDASSCARERFCDPQSIIIFVRASAPQCRRCRINHRMVVSIQRSYRGAFLQRDVVVDKPHSNNGVRDDTKRTVVVLRSVACAKSMSCVFFCSMWACLDAFGFVILYVKYMVMSRRFWFRRSVCQSLGDEVRELSLTESIKYHLNAPAMFFLAGSSPRSSCF